MKNKKLVFITAIIVFMGTILICSCIGAASISPLDAVMIMVKRIPFVNVDAYGITKATDNIIWSIRFPRVLTGAMVGGALGVAGAAYQGLLKNPMADPYILGISSGAAFGAAVAIVSGISFSFLGLNFTSLMAFVCAIAVVAVVNAIARVGRKTPMTTLLLGGVAIGQFLTAFTSLIMVFSGDDMQRIVYWTMGSLSGKGWDQLAMLLPYAAVCSLIIYAHAKDLNIMLLGEDTAGNLGLNVERTKRILLTVSAVLTAAAVSVAGIIGFVGLIVPHVVRLFVGPDHKVLLPLSFIFGGVLMVICDTLARSLISLEIPVGMITAILGGPFFIYLLRSRQKSGI